jgi:hypothetical protein
MSLTENDPLLSLKSQSCSQKLGLHLLAPIFHCVTWLNCARLTFVAVILSLDVGCAQKLETSVSGKVTFEGQPMQQGEITFFQAATGEVAQGTLGDGGAYSLATADKELSPGEYHVVIAPIRTYEKVTGPEGTDYKMVETGGESIPEKYRDRVNSPLKATVAPGMNDVDFELVK